MLATAERSGGLTQRISNKIVEDVLGEEIPEPLEKINPDQPFSLTMLYEKAKLEQLGTPAVSTPDSNKYDGNELEELINQLTGLVHSSKSLPEEQRRRLGILMSQIGG